MWGSSSLNWENLLTLLTSIQPGNDSNLTIFSSDSKFTILVNFESQIKMVKLETLFMMLSPDFQRNGGESPLGIKYTQEERHRMANQ